MKKKFMFAFLTLAMAACLAVGASCGGGGDSSSGNTPSSSEQDSGRDGFAVRFPNGGIFRTNHHRDSR